MKCPKPSYSGSHLLPLSQTMCCRGAEPISALSERERITLGQGAACDGESIGIALPRRALAIAASLCGAGDAAFEKIEQQRQIAQRIRKGVDSGRVDARF